MTVKIYKIPPENVSAIRQALSADEWARNGYTLRAAKGIGLDIPDYFLYVKAEDEFFAQHEADVLVEGVTAVEGNEFDNVKQAFEAEEANVASGVALFD
jgi:hypothetical protein